MTDVHALGKILVVAGGLICIGGMLLLLWEKIPFLGKLPGDLTFKSGNTHVYVPLASSIVVSLVVSALVWFVSHILKK